MTGALPPAVGFISQRDKGDWTPRRRAPVSTGLPPGTCPEIPRRVPSGLREVAIFKEEKRHEDGRRHINPRVTRVECELPQWNALPGRNRGGHIEIIEGREQGGDQICEKL